MDRANVFIINEPELSLHVQWQEKFVDGIMEASRETQFIHRHALTHNYSGQGGELRGDFASMTTSVRYPPSAARALGLLTSHNNDIEIYVEDTSTPNLWVKLLRKYLPPNIRLNDVNVLGSRVTVIQACKLDQQLDGRKKLYIIDGDLELLIGKHRPRLRHLYRLRGYCVENYLMHEDALVSAVTTLRDPLMCFIKFIF